MRFGWGAPAKKATTITVMTTVSGKRGFRSSGSAELSEIDQRNRNQSAKSISDDDDDLSHQKKVSAMCCPLYESEYDFWVCDCEV